MPFTSVSVPPTPDVSASGNEGIFETFRGSVSFVALLEVLHQDGHDHIDEHELRDEHEDDEKTRCKNRVHAAVSLTVIIGVAIVTKSVLRASFKN